MNIIWTFFVWMATCFVSDVVGASFGQDQLFAPHAINVNGLQHNHSVLVLFRKRATNHHDVVNVCKGVQVEYRNQVSGDLFAFIVTSADCLDFPDSGKDTYAIELRNEQQQEWCSELLWPDSGSQEKWIIHPQYNNKTKEHNIAVFLPGQKFLYDNDLIKLPEDGEILESRDGEISTWTDIFTQDGAFYKPRIEKFSCSSVINYNWCRFLYPFSPVKGFGICASIWSQRRPLQLSVGDSLTYKDEHGTVKFAGIATIARKHVFWGIPIQFTNIQLYASWLKEEAKKEYGN